MFLSIAGNLLRLFVSQNIYNLDTNRPQLVVLYSLITKSVYFFTLTHLPPIARILFNYQRGVQHLVYTALSLFAHSCSRNL